MNTPNFIFILISSVVFFIIPIFLKNKRQYYLSLSASAFIISTGWIFLPNNNGCVFR